MKEPSENIPANIVIDLAQATPSEYGESPLKFSPGPIIVPNSANRNYEEGIIPETPLSQIVAPDITSFETGILRGGKTSTPTASLHFQKRFGVDNDVVDLCSPLDSGKICAAYENIKAVESPPSNALPSSYEPKEENLFDLCSSSDSDNECYRGMNEVGEQCAAALQSTISSPSCAKRKSPDSDCSAESVDAFINGLSSMKKSQKKKIIADDNMDEMMWKDAAAEWNNNDRDQFDFPPDNFGILSYGSPDAALHTTASLPMPSIAMNALGRASLLANDADTVDAIKDVFSYLKEASQKAGANVAEARYAEYVDTDSKISSSSQRSISIIGNGAGSTTGVSGARASKAVNVVAIHNSQPSAGHRALPQQQSSSLSSSSSQSSTYTISSGLRKKGVAITQSQQATQNYSHGLPSAVVPHLFHASAPSQAAASVSAASASVSIEALRGSKRTVWTNYSAHLDDIDPCESEKSGAFSVSLPPDDLLLQQDIVELDSIDITLFNNTDAAIRARRDRTQLSMDNFVRKSSASLSSSSSSSSSSKQDTGQTASADVEWEVVLLVDSRERKQHGFVIGELESAGIRCIIQPLSLGDYLWVARPRIIGAQELCDDVLPAGTVVLNCIAERKTIEDLSSSIVDGRYYEQKRRLKLCGIGRSIYLVEGPMVVSGRCFIKPPTVRMAMAETQLECGMSVIRTRSVDHTVAVLRSLHRRVSSFFYARLAECMHDMDEIEKAFNEGMPASDTLSRQQRRRSSIGRRWSRGSGGASVVPVGDERDVLTNPCSFIFPLYSSFQRHCGKVSVDNMGDLFVQMVRQIHMCSVPAALRLKEKFGTIANLFIWLQQRSASQAEMELAELEKLGVTSQRFGPKLAHSIVQTLTANY